ncbi:sigma factor [Streptomyces dysideae]|uniref:sigma factor n=1 Tax=Streptomyces dysideae TaxID=909626 RepID=UPI00099EBB32|nr:sigma factor [Streptomyces dysideae]
MERGLRNEGFPSSWRNGCRVPRRSGTESSRSVLPEVEVLLRVATTLTTGPGHAEELVRDTLVRAYRMCDRYDGQQPRAWLLTLARPVPSRLERPPPRASRAVPGSKGMRRRRRRVSRVRECRC